MKAKAILLTLVLLVTVVFSGCGNKATQTPSGTPTPSPSPTAESTPTPTPTPAANAVTTASIVNDKAAFEKAISSTGTWIIAVLNDISTDKELTLDGTFKNGKKDTNGNDIVQRKIALYSQDENRNVTARYTLTAPKLTINSPNAGLWYGTFKGDLYVSAPNFTLVNATVDGNVYFTTDEAQSTFKKDETKGPCTITGKQELKK